MKNKIRIGEYILNYRKERRLTQTEFGELLGVSTQAVSKWERELSYPDIFLLSDISNLIGVSIDEMMGNDIRFFAHKISAYEEK
ncbi:MAG: helix-turn-helix transcriptional regulator [Ruminococcaceae bacterium]|nr:helix-turn-helix transcriptional regulator [Oscillospiraceae bacterium]